VPKHHPLASVNDVYNAILVEGDPIGQVMFFGPGAGEGPTASAVVSDILNIVGTLQSQRVAAKSEPQNPLLACTHQHYCQVSPMADIVSRFFVRLLAKDQAGVIGRIGTCFGNHEVSIESVVQIDVHGEIAEVVVVTHEVQESHFQAALAELREFANIQNVPSVLRVL